MGWKQPIFSLSAYIGGLEVQSRAINLIGASSGDRLCQFTLQYSTNLNAGEKKAKDTLFGLYLKRAAVLEKEHI